MFKKGKAGPGPGRPKGSLNKCTIEAKQLARGLLNDPTYRQNLRADLKKRNLEASIEAMLWHYAYGKPKEQIEVHWNLEKLTDRELDQLEAFVKRVS